MPEFFDFYPKTWNLPLEKNDLLNEFRTKRSGYRSHGAIIRRKSHNKGKDFQGNFRFFFSIVIFLILGLIKFR